MPLDTTTSLDRFEVVRSSIPERAESDNRIHGIVRLSNTEVSQICAVSHVSKSGYTKDDIQEIFSWYMANIVEQIFKYAPPEKIRTIADIGTGCGWLANAFALKGRDRIVAVDSNERGITAAREIARILGISKSLQWCVASIERLPFADRQIDATFCIEVIEHTGVDKRIIRELARITRQLLVITTPNKIFPVIRHDTRLPCCHWLPPGQLRDRYAAVFKRGASQENNLFWSPHQLLAALPDFERQSNFLQFRNYQDYLQANVNSQKDKFQGWAKTMQGSYYRAASWMGCRSIYFLPSLASTFRRRTVQ